MLLFIITLKFKYFRLIIEFRNKQNSCSFLKIYYFNYFVAPSLVNISINILVQTVAIFQRVSKLMTFNSSIEQETLSNHSYETPHKESKEPSLPPPNPPKKKKDAC